MNQLLLKTSSDWPQRWLRGFQRPFRQYAIRKELVRHTMFAERLLAHLAHEESVELGRFRIGRVLRTRSDVVVIMIEQLSSSKPIAALKLPLTSQAEQSISKHRETLIELRRLPALRSFVNHIPRVITWGSLEDHAYYLETALPGESCADLLGEQADSTPLQAAAHLITQLHQGTMQRLLVDQALFAKLAGNDLAMLRQLARQWPDAALLEEKLQVLERLLRRGIYDRELLLCWSHGDFWPGNILVERSTGSIEGIIDWDRASPLQPPLLDLLHLLAYTRKARLRTQLGEEIVRYLLSPAFDEYERKVITTAADALGLPHTSEFLQVCIWLYWLHFAVANLSRYPAFQTDRRWLRKNVFLVLKRGLL